MVEGSFQHLHHCTKPASAYKGVALCVPVAESSAFGVVHYAFHLSCESQGRNTYGNAQRRVWPPIAAMPSSTALVVLCIILASGTFGGSL